MSYFIIEIKYRDRVGGNPVSIAILETKSNGAHNPHLLIALVRTGAKYIGGMALTSPGKTLECSTQTLSV